MSHQCCRHFLLICLSIYFHFTDIEVISLFGYNFDIISCNCIPAWYINPLITRIIALWRYTTLTISHKHIIGVDSCSFHRNTIKLYHSIRSWNYLYSTSSSMRITRYSMCLSRWYSSWKLGTKFIIDQYLCRSYSSGIWWICIINCNLIVTNIIDTFN